MVMSLLLHDVQAQKATLSDLNKQQSETLATIANLKRRLTKAQALLVNEASKADLCQRDLKTTAALLKKKD